MNKNNEKNVWIDEFLTFTTNKMRNYKFLALYKWNVVLVYRIDNKYYLENRKEIKKSDFVFIA